MEEGARTILFSEFASEGGFVCRDTAMDFDLVLLILNGRKFFFILKG